MRFDFVVGHFVRRGHGDQVSAEENGEPGPCTLRPEWLRGPVWQGRVCQDPPAVHPCRLVREVSAQQGLTRTVSILLVYTVVCFVFLKIETTPYFVLFTCILIVINRKVKNANTKPKYEVDLTKKKKPKKKAGYWKWQRLPKGYPYCTDNSPYSFQDRKYLFWDQLYIY